VSHVLSKYKVRKKLPLIFAAFFVLLALENCKRDPPLVKQVVYSDPDSLYQGTKYTITRPFSFPSITNPYADSLTVEGIMLGRRLFYDKHLSLNGQMACASCHILSHAFADTIPLATNEFGLNKRNAPALINLAWAPTLFWDGRQPTIAAQAQDAFHNELGLVVASGITYLQHDSVYPGLFKKAFGRPGTITEHEIYLGIQEFLMTVISANSRFDSIMRGEPGESFTAAESDAFYNIFLTATGECFHCHAFGANYLMADLSTLDNQEYRNDGLQAAATVSDFVDPGRGGITGVSTDYGLFKNPTLRNVAVSGPYMHDGRFATLDQVINFYSDSLQSSPTVDPMIQLHMDTLNGQTLNHGGLHLTATQKAEMIQLLNDFTDPTFLNNPAYKNPF